MVRSRIKKTRINFWFQCNGWFETLTFKWVFKKADHPQMSERLIGCFCSKNDHLYEMKCEGCSGYNMNEYIQAKSLHIYQIFWNYFKRNNISLFSPLPKTLLLNEDPTEIYKHAHTHTPLPMAETDIFLIQTMTSQYGKSFIMRIIFKKYYSILCKSFPIFVHLLVISMRS